MKSDVDSHAEDALLRGPSERVAHALLSRMNVGTLVLIDTTGHLRRFEGRAPGPEAHVRVRDARAARRVLLGGGIGMAEGYIAGEWDTPDLDAVLDLGLANILEPPIHASAPLAPLQRAWHRLRDNSRLGARRNIAYHYDLGNDFYELWLDDSMTYSCATFDEANAGRPDVAQAGRGPTVGTAASEPLECAQRRKWDRLLELLQPSRKDRLLEIGCGWGGFAIHAAKEAGCSVTGITLSEEQAALAAERVAEEGLEAQVEIRLQDYRDVSDTYTAIASIEMFEAVGERWWPVFFGRVRDLLERGGAAALQTITIAEDRFERYRSHPDFTQRYIFPGGMLPSPERFRAAAASQGLEVGEPHFFGRDYAKTLTSWRERFDAVVPEITALGFDERFVRMWRYYLSYCRAGFAAGTIDVMRVRLDRP